MGASCGTDWSIPGTRGDKLCSLRHITYLLCVWASSANCGGVSAHPPYKAVTAEQCPAHRQPGSRSASVPLLLLVATTTGPSMSLT